MNNILTVSNLKTYFNTMEGTVKAVDGISFSLHPGEALGIAGETGSGKSVTVKSLMRNLPPYADCTADKIELDGIDLLKLNDAEYREILGNKIAMVFQNPSSYINPLFTVEQQMVDIIRQHQKVSKSEAKEKAKELLKLVGMPDPEAVLKQYPFQMSGGMIQRVMIALSLSCTPSLLIADEPTTALDVTIQAQILSLLGKIKERAGCLVLITHNLAIISDICDKMMVMYAGRAVEYGSVDEIMKNPQHPYTQGLIKAIPKLNASEKHLEYIPGNIPSLVSPPPGCRFSPRCEWAEKNCNSSQPAMRQVSDNHWVACYSCGKK